MTTVSPVRLREFAGQLLSRVGVPTPSADIVATSMIEADLRGIETHGIAKLPSYIDGIESGEFNAHAVPTVTRESASTAVVDGDRAVGGLAAHLAMSVAMAKARTVGVAAVAVRNVGPCGALSVFTSVPVQHGMIAIMTAQGTKVVPPFGGTTPLLNTSPWCLAVPAGAHPPIILDMASTTIARARLLAGAQRGLIPECSLLDQAGQPTVDPKDALTGLQTWIGGAKGFGLAVMAQVLAGILSGGTSNHFAPADDVSARGHFIIVINVETFLKIEDFALAVDRWVEELKSSTLLPGVDGVRMPGERAHLERIARLGSGIKLPRGVADELKAIGGRLGVAFHSPD